MGNREDLLRGATRCLLEKGWARTTVRDIAAAAGVSHAAIGYHYGSREALLDAALVSAITEWGQQLGHALTAITEATGTAPASDPEALWSAIVGSLAEHPQLSMVTTDALVQSEHEPALREVLAESHRQARRGLVAVLLGTNPDDVTEHESRTLGSVQLALITGVMVQLLVSRDLAPTAGEIVAGLRRLGPLVAAD